ncbi:bifunctional tetrahydrofolate synthase/dihydrofolate synthase [Simiduia sp. 21SJ11W-1]|uniref:bifunctional tetrahydrofolate synthase/dihydrofolate synthase n=1 Tax=Simiduia sp. 21SJ11W-1 TaxID=2909669 RepID=UPI0020A11653|nr:bifunctional tetrahydrofolate synthase/dihydrofolate synthase [Simiduia sp. 21SJ11W-1]UTA49285.1 bifunctional tetrahydrofolate synthase/dihydrofolate synthase [Simiduia sp. 21SJ11W-1]
MRFERLSDWLRWQEQHHPSAIELGLGRVRQVASRLDLLAPARAATKVITVAGTNGKGSAVATLAALLRAQGASVGAYTSPHLMDYNERIRVNGEPASDALICNAFAAIDACAQDISLTYFEFGTLAALWIFQQLAVDYWVLEVGLGGRLDAVNIVDADVAIITSIALDHQDWLGDDIAQIGREKAGIARAGKPLVYADAEPQASVLEAAQAAGAQCLLTGRDYTVRTFAGQCELRWGAHTLAFPEPHLPLPSVSAALVALLSLGLAINPVWVQRLGDLRVPGRFQQFTWQGRQWLLDVAHNPAACKYFAERARALDARGRTHAIVAMMADKDQAGALSELAPLVDEWFFANLPGNPRAARAEQLAALVPGSPRTLADVPAALNQALKDSRAGDSIWVLGSFFTVAAALQWLQAQGADVAPAGNN